MIVFWYNIEYEMMLECIKNSKEDKFKELEKEQHDKRMAKTNRRMVFIS